MLVVLFISFFFFAMGPLAGGVNFFWNTVESFVSQEPYRSSKDVKREAFLQKIFFFSTGTATCLLGTLAFVRMSMGVDLLIFVIGGSFIFMGCTGVYVGWSIEMKK